MASSSNILLNESTISEITVMDENSKEELEESTIHKEYPQTFNSVQQKESYGTSPAFKSDVKHEILTQKAKMNIKPHLGNATRDYLQLVREENIFKNEPEWDRSEECLIQDMIESKINNTLAAVMLEKKRQEYMQTRTERDKQIEGIKREELTLGASFIYFDKFVKENIEKRERFLEKIRSEKDIQDELNNQITQAENSIETLNDLKNEMIKCIESRKKFVDFLESVREISPDLFRNGVHEIIDRYELLMMVREELANEQARSIERMQELSDKIYKITKDRTEELMNLRNKVTELYRRYDAARRDSFYWESLVSKVEDMAVKQTLEISSVKNACWNLYQLICEHHKLPVLIEKRQIRKQLHVIENTILQLRRALYIAKKRKGKKIP